MYTAKPIWNSHNNSSAFLHFRNELHYFRSCPCHHQGWRMRSLFLSGHFSAFLPAGAAKRVKCVKIGLWQNKRDEKKMSIKRYCVQRQQKEPNHSCLRVWNSKTKIITNPIEKEIRIQFIQKLGIFEPTFCLIWLPKKNNLMLLNWWWITNVGF